MKVPVFERAPRAARPTRAKAPERRIIERGDPLCLACRDNGTLELYPEQVGEHCVRDVRRDLAAGALELCGCAMGAFWRTMLDHSPWARNGQGEQ